MKISDFKKNIPLAPFTTFRIGGVADYFFIAKSTEMIKQAISVAKELKLPFYILGNGSNVLVSDAGFRGLIIKVLNQKVDIQGNKIICEAGIALGALVGKALSENLAGLESLSGIPGGVGGALYGNAGAFGVAIGDLVEKVEFFDPKDLKTKTYPQKECHFDYRDSIFKQRGLIILNAIFKLKKIKNQKSVLKKINEIKAIRAKHPWQNCAGSVFKNIPIDILPNLKSLKTKIPASCFQFNEIKVACLLNHLSLKGKRIGGAEVSKQHSNFIINTGKASAQNVLDLIDFIRSEAYNTYNIVLDTEIQFLGFN